MTALKTGCSAPEVWGHSVACRTRGPSVGSPHLARRSGLHNPLIHSPLTGPVSDCPILPPGESGRNSSTGSLRLTCVLVQPKMPSTWGPSAAAYKALYLQNSRGVGHGHFWTRLRAPQPRRGGTNSARDPKPDNPGGVRGCFRTASHNGGGRCSRRF